MNILVTGSEGFIGKSLIFKLNQLGYKNIYAIDHKNKFSVDNRIIKKFYNWCDYKEQNYFDFISEIDFVFHLGANSSTREKLNDIKESNIFFTFDLLSECHERNIPVVFASSGAIYGSNKDIKSPNPLTDYGVTKLMGEHISFSKFFEDKNKNIKIVCLRYHNVYGPTESHKGDMASIISKWIDNYLKGENTNVLFSDSENIKRDFVHIDDINKINIMFLDYYIKNNDLGSEMIYDVGTGAPTSFLEVAENIIKYTKGEIKYIDNPYNKYNYQYYTKADIKGISSMYEKTYSKSYTPINILDGIKIVFEEKTKLKK